MESVQSTSAANNLMNGQTFICEVSFGSFEIAGGLVALQHVDGNNFVLVNDVAITAMSLNRSGLGLGQCMFGSFFCIHEQGLTSNNNLRALVLGGVKLMSVQGCLYRVVTLFWVVRNTLGVANAEVVGRRQLQRGDVHVIAAISCYCKDLTLGFLGRGGSGVESFATFFGYGDVDRLVRATLGRSVGGMLGSLR